LKLRKNCNTCGKKLDRPVLVEEKSIVKCGSCLVKEHENKDKMYYLNEFLEGWK